MTQLAKLSDRLYRITGAKSLALSFALLALTLVLLKVLNTPFGVKRIRIVSGDVKILDMQSGYTPDQAYATLEALGEAGRQAYVNFLLFGDILLPFAYGYFLIMALGMALRGILGTRPSPLRLLNALPVVPVVLDLIENAIILGMLAVWPERADGLALFASTFTVAKRGVLMLCFAGTGAGLIAWGIASVYRRTRA